MKSVAALAVLAVAAFASAVPSTFTVSANKRYWVKDGAPFITVGYNRYSVWNPNDPANDGLSVAGYVQRMAANGCNVIRVWAEQGDQNTSGDFWLESPSGVFRQSQEARLDALFDACDTYGVYVMICPWDTYNVKNLWSTHPYNSANGGPCATPADVVGTAAGRQLVKNKIQYMFNRWGSRKSFFLWTFNEIDILNTSSTAQEAFANDVGAYVNSIDAYHPFTISWTGTGAGNPAVVSLANNNAADIHFYGAISGIAGVAKENETALIRDGGYINFNKPLVLSEWGLKSAANSTDMVNAIAWGGIAVGASGTGMPWTDRYNYAPITAAHLSIFSNLRSFVDSVNWSTFLDSHRSSTTELSTSTRSVTAYGSQNATQAVVLLVGSRVGAATACTVTLKNVAPNRAFTISFWQTYSGSIHSTISATSSATGVLTFAAPSIATMQGVSIR